MKSFYRCLTGLLFLLIPVIHAVGQNTMPHNGPPDSRPEEEVFVHAKIQTDPNTRLENAMLHIKRGKVVYCGPERALPAGIPVTDLKGKFIYPSFIDLYTNYGVQLPQRSGQVSNYEPHHGPYLWNEATRCELNGSALFQWKEKDNQQLLECGFGTVVTGSHDGILRGTSALVFTGDGAEQELILQQEVAAGASFNKGSSRHDYPNAVMGSIALIRQSVLDAKWYAKQQQITNLGMKALHQQLGLPWIFEAENKYAVLRAANIGKEFGLKLWIKGAGDEYQRIREIKATGYPLILPLNFPKPYEVEDPFDARMVNLRDLKHWEMAPANAAIAEKEGIEFVLTANGCNDDGEFFKNLRLAVQHGLSQKAALAALTTTPATWLKQPLLGTLKPGSIANFTIWDRSLFDKDARMESHWVNGKVEYTRQATPVGITGVYKLKDVLFGYTAIEVKLSNNKTEARLYGNDTLNAQLSANAGIYTLKIPQTKQQGSSQLTFWVSKSDADGTAIEFNGNHPETRSYLVATRIGSTSVKEKSDSTEKPVIGKVIYPFTEYGNEVLPAPETVLFRNATVWTNETQGILKETDVLVSAGKIKLIGKNLQASGAKVIDATGKHLTNGIIDEHSHIAIYRGVNECSQNITAEVRIGDVINPDDINIYRQLSGGVVACQLLHGSCNPVGGQSALIKLRWGASPEQMKIQGADGFIKFALGENVKQSNWGSPSSRYPQTRMGVEQVYYDAFIRAREYEAKRKADPNKTRQDLELDALVEIIRGKRFISCHSYVQSEINMLMHVADSMGFKVNTFTHILEGYKVADKMKAHGVAASTFADWWAYKYEVIEAIPQNAAILNRVGVVTAINSDDAEMGRRLNQEAAKVVRYGHISEEDAWKMVTLNPAKMLHLDGQTGSILAGKDADLVVWSANPLSIDAKAEMTFVDGICYFSREKDAESRKAIQAERQRLIQKMIKAREKGEKGGKHVSEPDPDYHCDDVNH